MKKEHAYVNWEDKNHWKKSVIKYEQFKSKYNFSKPAKERGKEVEIIVYNL